MLTENELVWLERRERLEFPFCLSCDAVRTAVDGTGYCYPIEDCPLEARIEDWQESAEFEQRVAAKLAVYASMARDAEICTECPCEIHGICFEGIEMHCKDIFLKTARLQVEEEMDGQTFTQ